MNTWAIVPIKPLTRSKSRLAPALTGDQREALSRKMFEKTLTTLKQVQGINGILVVSRDSKALTLARQLEAQTVQESGTPELNDALTRATQAVTSWGARRVLIAASDIPLMTTQDIEAILKLSDQPEDVMVIATDRRQEGTNVLLLQPPGLIPYAYGPGSFQRHIAEAQRVEATVHVYESPTLALDIDFPDDLDLYRSILKDRKLNELAWLGSL